MIEHLNWTATLVFVGFFALAAVSAFSIFIFLRLPPQAVAGFAVLYGMSNGIMTVNRGTLPLAMFGPAGYAQMLGWLAVPVLLAQATAPTLTAPLVAALPAVDVLLISGVCAAIAVMFLLPLRLPAS